MADFSQTNAPEDIKVKSRQLVAENSKLAQEVKELTKRNGQLAETLDKLKAEFEEFKNSIEFVDEAEEKGKKGKK